MLSDTKARSIGANYCDVFQTFQVRKTLFDKRTLCPNLPLLYTTGSLTTTDFRFRSCLRTRVVNKQTQNTFNSVVTYLGCRKNS